MNARSKLFLPLLASSFAFLLLAYLSGIAIAKHDRPEEENMAIIFGEASERYPIFGSGGIKVSGGHHGIFMSNTKSSAIQIDGSGISAQKYVPSYMQADFTAAPNGAFFVSNSAKCTMPPAAGAAGQEIVVCNTGSNVTITYQAANGEPLPGSGPSGKLENLTPGKVDRFLSDGKTWYRE